MFKRRQLRYLLPYGHLKYQLENMIISNPDYDFHTQPFLIFDIIQKRAKISEDFPEATTKGWTTKNGIERKSYNNECNLFSV